MRDIQLRNPASTPIAGKPNAQNAARNEADIKTLSDRFQQSLQNVEQSVEQSAGSAQQELATPSENLHQSHLTLPVTQNTEQQSEQPAEQLGAHDTNKGSENLITDDDIKAETEVTGTMVSGVSPFGGEVNHQDLPLLSLTNTAGALQSTASNTDSAVIAVTKLLEQLEQLHRSLGAKQWQFEWLNGNTVRLSLKVSRTLDGHYTANIGECESELTRDEFISELNRRLEEKQYQIKVSNRND